MSSLEPVKPNFLVIGAARCATTSLHAYLEAHPDLYLSQIKETNFFSNPRFYERGMGWYLQHFAKARVGAVGEASTSYTAAIGSCDAVPARIARHLGSVKLIYLVRDPIERLLSHYVHYQHRGERIAPPHAVVNNPMFEDTRWQGRYHHQLQMYLRHFEADSILVISVDQLRAAPAEVLPRVFTHLGVDSMALDATSVSAKIHNSGNASTRKTPLGQWVLTQYARHLEPARIPYKVKSAVRRLAEIGSERIDSPTLDVDDIQHLRKFYRADLEALARDFGVDTSAWLSRS